MFLSYSGLVNACSRVSWWPVARRPTADVVQINRGLSYQVWARALLSPWSWIWREQCYLVYTSSTHFIPRTHQNHKVLNSLKCFWIKLNASKFVFQIPNITFRFVLKSPSFGPKVWWGWANTLMYWSDISIFNHNYSTFLNLKLWLIQTLC